MSSEFLSGVKYPHPFDELVVALCESARRQLFIQSPSLDYEVFDNGELADSISKLVRSSRQTEVRILINDPRPLVTRGHRLLELARRLPSSVRIQTLAEHPAVAAVHHPALTGDPELVARQTSGFSGVFSFPASTRLHPTATTSTSCALLVGSIIPYALFITLDSRHQTLASVLGTRCSRSAVTTSAQPTYGRKGTSCPGTLTRLRPRSTHACVFVR